MVEIFFQQLNRYVIYDPTRIFLCKLTYSVSDRLSNKVYTLLHIYIYIYIYIYISRKVVSTLNFHREVATFS